MTILMAALLTVMPMTASAENEYVIEKRTTTTDAVVRDAPRGKRVGIIPSGTELDVISLERVGRNAGIMYYLHTTVGYVWVEYTDYPEALEYFDPDSSEYVGQFRVTTYGDTVEDQGVWVGENTASGEPLVPYETVAVDRHVVPLGSWVYIEGIGVRKATDTGSAINGNMADLFVDDSCGVTFEDRDFWIIDTKDDYEEVEE